MKLKIIQSKNTNKAIVNKINDDQLKYTFPNKNLNNQSSSLDY